MYSVIVSQQGVVGVNYPQVVIPLNFPNLAYTDNGAFTAAMAYIGFNANNTIPDLYTSLLNSGVPLFDQYKVNGLKARFFANTIDVNTTNSTGSGIGNMVPTIYHFNDPDDITALNPATIERRMLGSGILPKTYNNISKNGLNFVYKQNKEGRQHWLNTNIIAANNIPTPTTNQTYGSGGYPSMFGGMKLVFMANNATVNNYNVGRLFVEWDVTFRGVSSTL